MLLLCRASSRHAPVLSVADRRKGQAVGLEHISGPLERLVTELTLESFPDLKHEIQCKHCGAVGQIETFLNPSNNATGMRCTACSEAHPIAPSVLWLRKGTKRVSTRGSRRLLAKLGAYCYGCGLSERVLKDVGIGFPHKHHTRPVARYGDGVVEIPVCRLCHELLSAVQRDRWALYGVRMAAADEVEEKIAAIFAEADARVSRLLDEPPSPVDETPDSARTAL